MQRTLIKPNENKHILDKDSEDWLGGTCAHGHNDETMCRNLHVIVVNRGYNKKC